LVKLYNCLEAFFIKNQKQKDHIGRNNLYLKDLKRDIAIIPIPICFKIN